jgi:hypothetical protein
MTAGECRKRKFKDKIAAELALANSGRRLHTRKSTEENSVRKCRCGFWHRAYDRDVARRQAGG